MTTDDCYFGMFTHEGKRYFVPTVPYQKHNKILDLERVNFGRLLKKSGVDTYYMVPMKVTVIKECLFNEGWEIVHNFNLSTVFKHKETGCAMELLHHIDVVFPEEYKEHFREIPEF